MLWTILGILVFTAGPVIVSLGLSFFSWDVINPADTLIAYGSTPSPCPPAFVCATSALTFVHDISDSGYAPGVDMITSATIAIRL